MGKYRTSGKMAPVADNYLQMPRPTNTYSERLDEFSGRSSEAFSNFEQLFLSTVVFQHIHQLQSRRQTLHDRQSTFTYPRTQFANSSAITANMVQMYTIFGRQVGSHYVSCPPSRSPARPLAPPSLRLSDPEKIPIPSETSSFQIFMLTATLLSPACHWHHHHLVRWHLPGSAQRQEARHPGPSHQRIQLRRGRLHPVRNPPALRILPSHRAPVY